MDTRAACCVMFTVSLFGCASVKSKSYDPDTALDGEFSTNCPQPNWSLSRHGRSSLAVVEQIPIAELKLAKLSLSYKAIPDPRQENRFVIDQDDLVGLFSSVDPAQFEFADGMITKVDYKISSEVGPIIKETAGLAAKMAAKAAFTGELECQQTLIDELSDFKTEQKTLKQAKARQTEVEGRFFNRPSAAMKLAVERADANVATIQIISKRIGPCCRLLPWLHPIQSTQ